MPQPITKMVPNPYITINQNALAKLPDMAILVTNIFAYWASIERDLSVMLVRLLGADATPAHAIFSILQTQALQSKALEAAAKSVLLPEQYEVFSAVMTVAESVQKTRNKLAHWSWASCKERPDMLLLGDPSALKERDRRMVALLQRQKPGGVNLVELLDRALFDNSGFTAFTKDDLEREVRDLKEAELIVRLFSLYADPSFGMAHAKAFGLPEDREAIRSGLLEKLNGTRLFREALAQIRPSQKSNP